MELLPDELRTRLPPIHGQDNESEPVVYARYSVFGTPLVWYAIEGQPEGGDYVFFGFVLGPNAFRTFLLSELQNMRGPDGETVERDLNFIEGRLTDVVPAPDL